MRFKEQAVVIEPEEIRFSHVIQNNHYRQTIHVKNVGNKSKRIQIFRPAIKVSSISRQGRCARVSLLCRISS